MSGATVDGIERFEGARCPDDEAAEMASGSELEEVEREDGTGFYAGDVAECTRELPAVAFGVVDDEGAAALAVASSSKFTFTGAKLAGFLNFVNVGGCSDGFEEIECGRGTGDGCGFKDFGVDDEGDFGDGGDLVTAGHKESWNGGCGEGGYGCESLLAKVDLLVPLSPNFGRCEHAAGSAHVSECCLSCAVGSSS